jgi:hypothetical protein
MNASVIFTSVAVAATIAIGPAASADATSATTHHTGINQLTFACGPHHKLVEKGWITRKRKDGVTEWIPPPHLDRGQPGVNTFHHPAKLLADGDEEGAA